MTPAIGAATRIPRDSHSVSRKNISDNALKVIHRLRSQGHQAFLVGGAVRDLLLGNQPKDFDVATDATPEKVHSLFGNSRIIGRRFRIVHVRFGRELIEVTTFRGHHGTGDEPGDSSQGSHQSTQGVLLRDNVFGSLEEDAIRRDFTVNALYYNVDDFSLFDHVDGLGDLQQRQLRIIGDAEQRYREDPVRMLRAVRFSAKLDFSIEPGTAAPIAELAYLLEAIPPARLFDEMLKLFMTGYAHRTFRLLCDHGLIEHLFPATATAMDDMPYARALIEAAMASTDARVAEDKPVTPAFLFAALLWPPTVQLQRQLEDRGKPSAEALSEAGNTITSEQIHHLSIPRRFSLPMFEIWSLQSLLQTRTGRGSQALMRLRRFRAAYDFLLLREQSGEDLDGLGKVWTKLQEELPAAAAETEDQPGARRRGRRHYPSRKPR